MVSTKPRDFSKIHWTLSYRFYKTSYDDGTMQEDIIPVPGVRYQTESTNGSEIEIQLKVTILIWPTLEIESKLTMVMMQ